MARDPQRLSAAVACALAAGRASDAIAMWVNELDPKEREEVRRRLRERQEWHAAGLWDEVCLALEDCEKINLKTPAN